MTRIAIVASSEKLRSSLGAAPRASDDFEVVGVAASSAGVPPSADIVLIARGSEPIYFRTLTGTSMPEGPIEAQLLNCEKQYWQAIKDRDVAAAMRLTDDTCIITGAQGVARITRDAFAGMLQAGGWTLHEFT